jgi:hypothetical protein
MKRMVALIAVASLAVVAGCGGPPPPRGAVGGPEVLAGGALFKYRNSDAKKVYLVVTSMTGPRWPTP